MDGEQPGRAGLARGGPATEPGMARYRPGRQSDLAPSGARARFTANVAALETLRSLDGRPATPEQQAVLARWGSWGAIPQVFDVGNTDWAEARKRLHGLLGEREWEQARRTTINAHYTDPAYATEMWNTLAGLGFTGGRVLEPGCGSGTFIGLAPENAQMVGVELDPTTAGIAQALYPHATIRAESFADTRMPSDSFDAAVGNVPFADVRLHDATHNPGHLTMHNHFIVKSLALTRPGGMVAVLTSSFTMDAANPAARRAMNELGDLVGAVRLPSGAHRRAAGTEALTDLLIFRRREPGREPADRAWETVTAVEVEGHRVKVNAYYAARPERVLGDWHVGHGMYGAETLQVHAGDLEATGDRLRGALSGIVADARAAGLVFTAPTAGTHQEARRSGPGPAAERAATQLWDGSIVATDTGFAVAEGGVLADLAVPKTLQAELRALLVLRDGARGVLEREAASGQDTEELAAARTALHADYERYVDRYGPINRYSLRRTGRTEPAFDPATGAPILDEAGNLTVTEKMARITPRAVAVLRQDPYGALVRALEVFDDETQRAAPAQLLERRVVAPRVISDGADTPADALAMSLDATGTVELPRIAHLLGVEPAEARAQLGTLVYDEPGGDALIPAPEYLSGNVRVKLADAEAAATADERYRPNVDALAAVIPPMIGADQIEARLGAVWVSPEIHQQFLREVLNERGVRVENPLPGQWIVSGGRVGVLARSEWGTGRRAAGDLAQAVMEQKQIEVRDEIDEGGGHKRYVLNPVETEAAQAKGEALQERFAEWVWEDPARTEALVGEYNRRFNAIVLRDYTSAGQRLTLPGLAETIWLREHQRAAIARMIAEPAVGLFHATGAGKTLEMIAGVTELRRLGMIRKPVIIVPNHMLEQWSREWLQAYPQARILAASSHEVTPDKRRLFVARAATNDWDGIVMTHKAFQKIDMDPGFQADYIDAQVADLRAAKEAANAAGASRASVKAIEKAVMKAEEKHKKALDTPRDPGISFPDLGVDYIACDEAHLFKNLATVSNIRDANIPGSGHANDLHMKLEWLRARYGTRVATLATATPLANSITEAHVMQRFLRPDLLREAGVQAFDAWAATFGSQVSAMEAGPAGGFRLKTRFARFQNVPEMLRMWHVFADLKIAEDLDLPVPQIAARATDGRREPETVVLDPTPELAEYIGRIAERAQLVADRAVDVREDNMLLISTDGRKAALDLRLVDEHAQQTAPVKIDAVAGRILAEWRATRANVYLDETGQQSPSPGALQLVFCDLGTPHPGRWNAYDQLRATLVAGGLPHDQVRFIHDAKTDQDKARLFAAARAGHVSVLVGSTAKMGVGTNVQDRITALHHVDCPWRPADLEQRDGRAIRQGNQNDQVRIYRYVVETSFDAYSWQTVSRKAAFVNQIMRGRLDMREVEDIGDASMSASATMALASGNPLLLEKATAADALAKLNRQRVAHDRAQSSLRFTRSGAQAQAGHLTGELAALRAAALRTTDVSGEKFRITIGQRTHTDRAAAAEHLGAWARDHSHEWMPPGPGRQPAPCATLAGHTVTVTAERDPLTNELTAVLALDEVPRSSSRVPAEQLQNASGGLIRQLENKTIAVARHAREAQTQLEKTRATIAEAETRIGQPFTHADDLAQAAATLTEIDRRIAEAATAADAGQTPSKLDKARAALAATRANQPTPPPGPQQRRPGRDPRRAPPAASPDTHRGPTLT